jgi:hypothetical protein
MPAVANKFGTTGLMRSGWMNRRRNLNSIMVRKSTAFGRSDFTDIKTFVLGQSGQVMKWWNGYSWVVISSS